MEQWIERQARARRIERELTAREAMAFLAMRVRWEGRLRELRRAAGTEVPARPPDATESNEAA